MIGRKKLSTVRQEVRDAFVKSGHDPILWLDREIKRLEKQPRRAGDACQIETLTLLRDALAEGGKRAAKKRKRPVRSRS
jgi:hypothetical protein